MPGQNDRARCGTQTEAGLEDSRLREADCESAMRGQRLPAFDKPQNILEPQIHTDEHGLGEKPAVFCFHKNRVYPA